MYVEIVKCSWANYWYADAIGSTIEVTEHDNETYEVISDNEKTNFIKHLVNKNDCKILEEEPIYFG